MRYFSKQGIAFHILVK